MQNKKIAELSIPEEVIKTAETLEKAGFQAYIVGGCVRDLFLDKKPKDWDLTTNAKPEDIIKLFSKTFYENVYGTVGIVNEETTDETLKVIEITPYRLEAKYSDARRPDSVTWSEKLEDDLKRRDFTINAIALKIHEGHKKVSEEIIDLYKGQADIKDKTIRAVGRAEERFTEDALRIVRAIRLASELHFKIEPETEEGIKKTVYLLDKISAERIRDEFVKIIMSDQPKHGLEMAQKLGVLKIILPEVEASIGIEQNQAHKFDVWEHTLRSLQHSADKKLALEVRLAALFHDLGKVPTRQYSEEKKDWTFHGHEVLSARIAKKILERMKFSNKIAEKTLKLTRWHMFFSDTEQITLSAVRRMVRNVGQENIWDLMDLRMCDRIGTGRPKESPYRLRKYQAMIEEALRSPVSVGMLKIDGAKVMEITKLQAGPKIGFILHALLEEAINNPDINAPEYLEKRAKELAELSEEELKKLGEKGKETKEEMDEKEIEQIRKRHFVE